MRISMHPELERGVELFNDGKIEEALQVINNVEQLEDLSLEDTHYYRSIKGTILIYMGKFQESLKLAEEDYQNSKIQNRHLFLIDSLTAKFFSLFLLGQQQNVREDLVLCEKLIESIIQEPPSEIILRRGYLLLMKGYLTAREGKIDNGIELVKESLAILENYDYAKNVRAINLSELGQSFTLKGELDLALVYWGKYLDLLKGSTTIPKMMRGITYNNIGNIYFQKGDLDQAITYFEKSLDLIQQVPNIYGIVFSGSSYDSMIKVFLYKNSVEKAQECFDRFSQYLEENQKLVETHLQYQDPLELSWYRISRARILALSSRARDITKAQKILRKLVEEHPNNFVGLTLLCELYFQELKTSSNLDILEDIQPLVDKLSKLAEQSNSFSGRAHTFLLNGQISLLRLNMGDARRYLTEAQQIADSHNLQLLARGISHAHDRLIEQLEGFESYKRKKMTLKERLELASLDETLDLMQERRAVNAPKLNDEEPVILLILAGGGFLLFSYPFSDEVKVEDEIFGGFLSAITSFSDEVFSQGLDRAKFGQYTVLMKDIANFSFCYVFKGQTYLAKKKFSDFIEDFQNNDSMMVTLKKFERVSQVIELKDFPFFEGFIKKSFIDR
ncbi:MAG: tetratricopeptide repeat protein [Promethearchaeota archaeon]